MKTPKQEAIFLLGINDGFQALRVVYAFMTPYTTERAHSAFEWLTPDDAFCQT